MAQVIDTRMAARIEGDFVVFLIGARINKPWKLGNLIWFLGTMPRMLKELAALPAEETGFLGHTTLGLGTIVQYWRSFDDLERYARARDRTHFPAWIEFNRRFKAARGDVGIWHETYLIRAGNYEAIYSGMPRHGLGKAAELVPATGSREDARKRLST